MPIDSYGCFGINRFQFCAMLTWFFALFMDTQMIFPIYSNYLPRWKCSDFSNQTSVFHDKSNISTTLPLISSSYEFSRDCSIYSSCSSDHLQFEQPILFYSSALEFGWICGTNSAYHRALYSQVIFAGVILGTICFGLLTDNFGRRPVSMSLLSFGILNILVSSFAKSWYFLLFIRFLIGISLGGCMFSVYALVNELILPSQRMVIQGFFNHGSNRLLMTLLCSLFSDWRSASIVCALACLPALLFVIFILPESPTWLHNKDKIDKKIESEKKIASIAGIPSIKTVHKPCPYPIKQQKLHDLIREKAFFKRIVVLWIMWFTASLSTFIIDLNSSSITESLFLNQFLISTLITISKICLFFVDKYFPNFSRRTLHQWAQFFAILCFLALSILMIIGYQGVGIMFSNLIGMTFIELTWDACCLCAIESVPTPLRSSTVGSCSMIARFGALLAPVMVFLNSLWVASAYVTVILLGSLNLLISYFGLVETKGVDLDAVNLAKQSQTSKNTNRSIVETEQNRDKPEEKITNC